MSATITAGKLVERSLEVIQDGQASSGAFLASPTFEQYRFSWFRDGAFVAEAVDLHGRLDSSARFHAWAARIIAGAAEGMTRAIATALAGDEPDPGDYLDCRYAAGGGSGAGVGLHDEGWPTFQLDGPAIWLWSLVHHLQHGGTLTADVREVVPLTARYLAALWQTPCFDAWEEFGDRVHTSTVAAIAAGLEAAVVLEPTLARDRSLRAARSDIAARLTHGAGPYTKWEGSDEVDASLLWMVAPYGLLAPDDVRFAATLDAIESGLIRDGHGVHRYASDTFYGGGAWPVLTAAHGRTLLRRGAVGDRQRAAASLAWIESTADEDGLLPEQVADHALAPDRVAAWNDEWGPCAQPLLWSHAAYLCLRAELATGHEDGTSTVPAVPR